MHCFYNNCQNIHNSVIMDLYIGVKEVVFSKAFPDAFFYTRKFQVMHSRMRLVIGNIVWLG